MVAESNTALKARAQRFAREARAGPPALPKKNFAHPGGKITTNNKDDCLRKLIERKKANGQQLTAEQMQALGESVPSELPGAPSSTKLTPMPLQQLQASHGNEAGVRRNTQRQPLKLTKPQVKSKPAEAEDSSRGRTLARKLRDIENLEKKLAAGERLEANQMEKVHKKTVITEQLAQVRMEVRPLAAH